MVLFLGDHLHWSIYDQLLYSVRTGKRAFDHVLGQEPFQYLSEHPEDARVFDEAMTSFSSTSSAAVADAYDFSSFRTVMDLGGGNGALLAAILRKYPDLRGILFDSEHVIERARQAAVVKPGQCEMVHGDFFRNIPSGADAYLFKHVIHDWDDEHALKILQNCRSAISKSGKLLIVEMIVPPGNDPAYVKLLDLEMLMIPGGLERTEEEFRRLLAAAGFQLTKSVPTQAEVNVIEADPI
jgi:SAM-dependent methyltransferase